jgi:hypothetical protein
VTTGTLVELHWEALPHPAYSCDLAPGDFHLFGPLKQTLGEKDLEPMMKLNILCKNGRTSNHDETARATENMQKIRIIF